MQRRIVRIITVLLVLVFTAYPVVLAASELDQKLQELDKIEQQIQDKRNRLQSSQKQEKAALSELKKLEADLEKAENELAVLKSKLSSTASSVQAAASELKAAEANLAKRQDYLGRRVRAIYENGVVGLLDVLLAANDFSDFVNRYSFLQDIVRQDVQILDQVQAEKAAIAAKKLELEVKQAELTRITKQTTAKRNTVENRANEREKLITTLNKEQAAYEAALDELEKSSLEIEKTIQALQSKENGGSKPVAGTMLWPVSGRITSPYGNRFHPVLKKWKLHTGVDLAAATGTPIKAVASGKVIVSATLSGYGKTIIIDHGGGISTLYGHNSALLFSVGKTVAKGEVIAKAGSTGLSTGPHCHFEVRSNGSPVDPMKWLTKR